MSNAVQSRLDLSTSSSGEVGYVKNYLKIPSSVTEDDNLITNLMEAAKEDADAYLNNNFTKIKGQVIVGSPDNGDTITIDSETFTKQSSTSVEDREFADASGLVSCINSQLISVNGVEVGIPYIDATNDAGTVTLDHDIAYDRPTLSTSNESELKIQYKKIEENIPEDVKDGVLKIIANKYYQRADGLESENSQHGGSGSMSWGEIKREYLAPYRLITEL